jgi:hypothetical protein
MRFGAALLNLLARSLHFGCERAIRPMLATSRAWQCFVILLVACVPAVGWAQVGRVFVSAEAYVGLVVRH